MNWIDVANRVLETVNDSIEGFDHVAEHSHQFGFYAYCERHAVLRRKAAAELDRLIEMQGAHAENHGTFVGTAHRLLLDFRATLSSGDIAIFHEMLRGEGVLHDLVRRSLTRRTPADLAGVLKVLNEDLVQSISELSASLVRAGAPARNGRPA